MDVVRRAYDRKNFLEGLRYRAIIPRVQREYRDMQYEAARMRAAGIDPPADFIQRARRLQDHDRELRDLARRPLPYAEFKEKPPPTIPTKRIKPKQTRPIYVTNYVSSTMNKSGEPSNYEPNLKVKVKKR
jgi:hypothetical protein